MRSRLNGGLKPCVAQIFTRLCALALMASPAGCAPAQLDAEHPRAPTAAADAFAVDVAELHRPTTFIVYGDMRFTDVSETTASRPGPRRALVAKIAAERPDAVFLTGDVPWHGGNENDYRVFREETAAWRSVQLRVFPVLGNHEFQQCAQADCLEHWWQTFAPLRGRRWYAVALGEQLRFFALDSDASLLPGSEQAGWLQQEIDALSGSVRFVVVLLHHPPLTDAPEGVRANEAALATRLAAAVPQISARFVVCAAHVHNYERFERAGVTYLVSGGGGAKPSPVTRTAADRYQGESFPNFHFLRFELTAHQLRGEMIRLSDADAIAPGIWAVQDRFEVNAAAP
jgi:3',5'-cyclic AMP phosphodiesterase CpdA